MQAQTGPLMAAIDWRALPNRNVDVTNATSDLYRFFDCTAAAEFLYECVKWPVEVDLPLLKTFAVTLKPVRSAVASIESAPQIIGHLRP